MSNQHTIKNAVQAALFAGLLGLSTAGLAQSHAIDTLNATNVASSTAARVTQYPMADQLANALDTYNDAVAPGIDASSQQFADSPARSVSPMAQQLSRELDAYNSKTSQGLTPQTRSIASEPTATPMADQLASDLNAFNRAGGSAIN